MKSKVKTKVFRLSSDIVPNKIDLTVFSLHKDNPPAFKLNMKTLKFKTHLKVIFKNRNSNYLSTLYRKNSRYRWRGRKDVLYFYRNRREKKPLPKSRTQRKDS